MCAYKIVCCTTVFSFAVVRQISYYIIQTAESIREVFKQWRVENLTVRKMHLLRIHSLINPSVDLDSPGVPVLYPKMHAACSLSVLVQKLKPCLTAEYH